MVLYDVTVVETSNTGAVDLFQLPPLGKMPWWGSQSDADFFAGEVFDALGEGSTAGYGPLFAYDYNASSAEVIGSLADLSAPGSFIDGNPAATATVKYAFANANATTPVPGPRSPASLRRRRGLWLVAPAQATPTHPLSASGAAIERLLVSFNGEQWRNGGNTTAQRRRHRHQSHRLMPRHRCDP
ncbi:MAG: hypothetical protein ACKO22_08060 [Cyanobium sp.]